MLNLHPVDLGLPIWVGKGMNEFYPTAQSYINWKLLIYIIVVSVYQADALVWFHMCISDLVEVVLGVVVIRIDVAISSQGDLDDVTSQSLELADR